MRDRLFMKIIFAITVIGVLATASLVAYTVYLHQHCSIITFIANGG